MKRLFSRRQRIILLFVAGGKCQICNQRLKREFHADHISPFSKGGKTITSNGQALCPKCNTSKGNKDMQTKLRPWQYEALDKCLYWLLEKKADRHFIINAAPGSGKTIAACAIAQKFIERDEIDRVIVLAPRSEVVNQWSADFSQVTGRYMSKATGADGDVQHLGVDICATWSAVQGLQDGFQAICRSARTLLICDEHHHAALKASWGTGAEGAFSDAAFVLILTGTPIRSDGERTVWLSYDETNTIDHPEEGTYSLTYGEAVDLGYCRPVTFHRHEAKFTVDLDGGECIEVSSHKPAKLANNLKRVRGLQTALDFYKLACRESYEKDGVTPLTNSYQGTMLEWACEKLDDLRKRMPEAGGLVIAPNIEMAKYMAKLIELIEGEAPAIVHSHEGNSGSRIKAFRNTNKRWIVSVAMISEGVDIKRLRVLVYLPSALTELAFRQAIGRVVRTMGPEDDTRAYVIMPSTELFDSYARVVEQEMSPEAQKINQEPKTKKCPICRTECEVSMNLCNYCEYEFPQRPVPDRFKSCISCNALNTHKAKNCHECGDSFGVKFSLTLDEALRTGAIIRGMDIDENDVVEGERIAQSVRDKVLASGDKILIQFVKAMPEETYARLHDILSSSVKQDTWNKPNENSFERKVA
jgi:superfamily II DNA or RNA helicase